MIVSFCLGPLQSGGYGALSLMGQAVNGLKSSGGARYLRFVVQETDSEMVICMQEVYWVVPLDLHLQKSKSSSIG